MKRSRKQDDTDQSSKDRRRPHVDICCVIGCNWPDTTYCSYCHRHFCPEHYYTSRMHSCVPSSLEPLGLNFNRPPTQLVQWTPAHGTILPRTILPSSSSSNVDTGWSQTSNRLNMPIVNAAAYFPSAPAWTFPINIPTHAAASSSYGWSPAAGPSLGVPWMSSYANPSSQPIQLNPEPPSVAVASASRGELCGGNDGTGNPPCMCSHTVESLKALYESNNLRQLCERSGCGHKFIDHPSTPAGSSKFVLDVNTVTPSILRLVCFLPPVKAKAKSAKQPAVKAKPPCWQVIGQAVCIIDSHIFLTCAHVCFEQTKVLDKDLRLLEQPSDGGRPRLHKVQLLRYSGLMDMAVLMVLTENPPFTPLEIAPATTPVLKPNLCGTELVGLARYPIIVDIDKKGSQDDIIIDGSELMRRPTISWAAVETTRELTEQSKRDPSIKRKFTKHTSSYSCFKGDSGSAVISSESSPKLLGIHIQELFQTSASHVLLTLQSVGEFDGRLLASSSSVAPTLASLKQAQQAQQQSVIAEAAATSSSVHSSPVGSYKNPSPNTTPSSGVKSMEPVAEDIPHKSSLSVFVGAASVLEQNAGWSPAEILADLGRFRPELNETAAVIAASVLLPKQAAQSSQSSKKVDYANKFFDANYKDSDSTHTQQMKESTLRFE